MKRAALGLVLGLLSSAAFGQQLLSPSGQPVLNQGVNARALTKSDSTIFLVTRGVFIGDATACNIAVLFVADANPVTLTNVQSGQTYPFQIIKLMSTGTTCATVFALY
jgi:hypothetical protein